jgi:hypothetical protein
MTAVMMVTDGVALTLFERYGKSALTYADEQVKAALKGGDWQRVKAWRTIGSEVEKLLRPRFSARIPDPPTRVDG